MATFPSAWAKRESNRSWSDEVIKTVRLPHGGVRRDHYDFLRKIRFQSRPDGSSVRYSFDDQDRLTAIEHSSGQRVDYEYSEDGREWSLRTAETELTLRLNHEGLPVELRQVVDSREWTIEYRRDRDGVAEAVRYPQSRDWLELNRKSPGSLTVRCGSREYVRVGRGDAPGHSCARFQTGVRTAELVSQSRVAGLTIRDATGNTVLHRRFEHDERGRITRAGNFDYEYDEAGRLASAHSPKSQVSWAYDKRGRRSSERRDDRELHFTYSDSPAIETVGGGDSGPVRFVYDRLGRRTKKIDSSGVTQYGYNLFSQLEHVAFPNGDFIRYIYDGLGRLVGRKTKDDIRYFIVDFESRRIAQAERSGEITDSYLWLGQQCVGRVKGPLGEPLAETFHWGHAGRLEAIGDPTGQLTLPGGEDPFGSDSYPSLDRPSYAGLFGDPATGLMQAGARWLDPAIAQFTTPDEWYGDDPAKSLPPKLRKLFRALPGGPRRILDREAAYNWCAHDPVNFVDPNGHNWVGLIFTFISAMLWEMQLTSLSLQLEMINILFDCVLVLVGVLGAFWASDDYPDWYWRRSIYNLAPPTASYRLMVPFAFWLNGVWRPNAAFTFGNIVWDHGSDLRDIEGRAVRGVLIVEGASTMVASVDSIADDIFRARNPAVVATGSVNGTGRVINGPAITTPAGAAVGDVLRNDDRIGVRLPGSIAWEVARIGSINPGPPLTIDVIPALPSALQGQNVEFVRLDQSIVRMQGDGRTIARQIRFISGDVVHFGLQIPEGIPSGSLAVAEYLPAAIRDIQPAVNLPIERIIVRTPAGADLTAFAAGDFVRIDAGPNVVARGIGDVNARREIVLDGALPPGNYDNVEVREMTAAGAAAVGQDALSGPAGAGTRVQVDRNLDLRLRDGLEISGTGAAAPEKRIVTLLLLDCPVAAVPGALQGVAVGVDQLDSDDTVQATGPVGGNGTQVQSGDAGKFSSGRAVRIGDGVADEYSVVDSVAVDQINFTEPISIADSTNVTVTLMVSTGSFSADELAAPGDHVFVTVNVPGDLSNGAVIRIRPEAAEDGGVVRVISADPTVVAQLNSALTGGIATGLDVQRFEPGPGLIERATAPEVRFRLNLGGGANPFSAGDELYLRGAEQAIAEVARIDGANVFLTTPIDLNLNPSVRVERVRPTGINLNDGRLEEGLVLIPSDMGEDPTTRRRALENHEMRHVFQEALWGPMFISMPIPWLFHLGFSFSDLDHRASKSKPLRWLNVGGLDSLFANIAWGIGGAESPITFSGTLSADRKTVQFADDAEAEMVAKFSDSSRVDLLKDPDVEDFNVVEELSADQKRVELRFAASENRFSGGDTVRLRMSPFEQVRKTVNTWFSLNLEQLWSDHIPTGWGRALSKVLNRDSWLPPFGLYPLAWALAGTDRNRIPFEQDAAYHSGDLYTDIPLSFPNRIFAGQFSRIFSFIQARHADVQGLSARNPLRMLQVTLDSAASAADVPGAVDLGGSDIGFRETHLIPMHERVENVVGALFTSSVPGDYAIVVPNPLTSPVVLSGAMDTDFTQLGTVHVQALTLAPPPARGAFETEVVEFRAAEGDGTAQYDLRQQAGLAGIGARISSMQYIPPVLLGGAATDHLEITATYDENHSVFRGPGQQGAVRLRPDQRTNVAMRFNFQVSPLSVPTVGGGTVQANSTTDFQTDIRPRDWRVTSAMPPGATVNARIILGDGRPAQNRFIAPDAVNSSFNVQVELIFGPDATTQRIIPMTVQVDPAP